jgi:hypothetical protein
MPKQAANTLSRLQDIQKVSIKKKKALTKQHRQYIKGVTEVLLNCTQLKCFANGTSNEVEMY